MKLVASQSIRASSLFLLQAPSGAMFSGTNRFTSTFLRSTSEVNVSPSLVFDPLTVSLSFLVAHLLNSIKSPYPIFSLLSSVVLLCDICFIFLSLLVLLLHVHLKFSSDYSFSKNVLFISRPKFYLLEFDPHW